MGWFGYQAVFLHRHADIPCGFALFGFDLERRVDEGHGAASIPRGRKDKARAGLDARNHKSDLKRYINRKYK